MSSLRETRDALQQEAQKLRDELQSKTVRQAESVATLRLLQDGEKGVISRVAAFMKMTSTIETLDVSSSRLRKDRLDY